jgi:hypothetical protein
MEGGYKVSRILREAGLVDFGIRLAEELKR